MKTITNPDITPSIEPITTSTARKRRMRSIYMVFLGILARDLLVTRRQLVAFLTQFLLQPLFFLFVFGVILPGVGIAKHGYGALLLPGIVALTVVTTSLQGVAQPLVLDLGIGREIDDRLLSPLPTSLVAIEKVVFGAIRGLIAGAVIFPLAYLILGNEFAVRSDAIGVIIAVMILTALAAGSIGLTLGTLVEPGQIGLAFALILTPLIFTGCVQYPWGTLSSLRWFQIITLINPLTYASEGLRYAMMPLVNGQMPVTLGLGWVFLGLIVSCLVFLTTGLTIFQRRVKN
jgi:ABC-2 type transport system permease protein